MFLSGWSLVINYCIWLVEQVTAGCLNCGQLLACSKLLLANLKMAHLSANRAITRGSRTSQMISKTSQPNILNQALNGSAHTACPNPVPDGDFSVLSLNQAYDPSRALRKKSEACDRVASVEDKSGNLVICLDTCSFEMTRNELLNTVHVPRSGSSRNLQYTQVNDCNGLVVQDTIHAKNWSGLGRLAAPNKGPCSITINLYRTSSKILINGNDYLKLLKPMEKLVEKITNNQAILDANKAIKRHVGGNRNTEKKTENKKGRHGSQLNSDWRARPQLTDRTLNTDKPILPLRDECPDIQDDGISENVFCPVCTKTVQNKGVLCETCATWYHYRCQNLTTIQIKEIEETNSPYACPSCQTCTDDTDGSHEEAYATRPRRERCIEGGDSVHQMAIAEAEVSLLPVTATDGEANTLQPLPDLSVYEPPTPNGTPAALDQADPENSPCNQMQMSPPTGEQGLHAGLLNSLPGPYTAPSQKEPQRTGRKATGGIIAKRDRQLNVGPYEEEDALTSTQRAQQEYETEQKKLRTKERLLKQREKAIELREEELSTITQQNALLKATVCKLELRIKDLEQENRELKLKLLASDDVREIHPQLQSKNMNPLLQNQNIQDLLMTAVTAVLVSVIERKGNNECQHPESCGDQHRPNRHKHGHRPYRHPNHQNSSRWRPRERASRSHGEEWKPVVYEYNHSGLPSSNGVVDDSLVAAKGRHQPAKPAPLFIDLTADEGDCHDSALLLIDLTIDEVVPGEQDKLEGDPGTSEPATLHDTADDDSESAPKGEEVQPDGEEKQTTEDEGEGEDAPMGQVPAPSFLIIARPPEAPDKSGFIHQTSKDCSQMLVMQST